MKDLNSFLYGDTKINYATNCIESVCISSLIGADIGWRTIQIQFRLFCPASDLKLGVSESKTLPLANFQNILTTDTFNIT